MQSGHRRWLWGLPAVAVLALGGLATYRMRTYDPRVEGCFTDLRTRQPDETHPPANRFYRLPDAKRGELLARMQRETKACRSHRFRTVSPDFLEADDSHIVLHEGGLRRTIKGEAKTPWGFEDDPTFRGWTVVVMDYGRPVAPWWKRWLARLGISVP